ncbi:MAG: hypothetical protein JSR45_16385 [Proteobacteria bacterium]|nr:hypothetical protein [Pseudomonadota bacterium]
MADGFHIELDSETTDLLKAAAEAAGVAPEAYAQTLLTTALSEDWAEDLARLAEYDRTGEYVTVEEAMANFDRALREAREAAGRQG